MSGELGTRDRPLEFHAEQLDFEVRTSDPATPLVGEMWLRSDLDSGDKVATLRWNENGTMRDIPVFGLGTSGSDVEEVFRMQTPNGVGYVPVTDTSPTYSQLGFQHAGARHGWHDATTTSAIPSVVDRFEEQQYEDKTNTLSDYYGGDLSQFTRQQTVVIEGNYTLEGSQSSGGFSGITSTSGLNNYPSAGDTFRSEVRTGTTGGQKLRIIFAAQSAVNDPNCYYAQINRAEPSFRLVNRGGTVELASASQSYSDNTVYDVEIDWQSDGTITATLFDDTGSQLNQISGSDTQYSSGGVGFLINSATSSTGYWDNYRI